MKYILFSILYLFLFFTSNSQNVTVIDKFSNFEMGGVEVYALNSTDTLQTNSEGNVNIGVFPNDATIIFSYFYFKTVRYTKEELSKMYNVVYMERGDALGQLSLTSPLKLKEYSADLPFFVDIIDLDEETSFGTANKNSSERITFTNNEGGMSVFRGLQSGEMLLVIDGVRLNNAIHKNGKVERLLNYENTMTDKVRQIYGVGFSIYSPEATGGVIHYFTPTPPVSQDYSLDFELEANTKYESASNSSISNFNLSLAGLKFSSFTSVSYGNFGEVTMGKNRKNVPAIDSLYGLNTNYIQNYNDTDVVVINENPYVQKNTDYEQFYVLQNLRFKIGDNSNLLLNFHYISNSEIGIYSGLTEINGDHLRFSICQFEPQQKYIASANYLYDKKTLLYDFISVLGSFIHFNEYRVTRKFKNPVALHQIENLSVSKFNIDIVKLFHINRMLYGIEYYYNDLKSNAYFYNVDTEFTWRGLNRYPTNGSYSHDLAAYWNFKWLQNAGFIVNLGLRYNFNFTNTKFDNSPPQLPLDFEEKTYLNHAPAASVSADYYPFKGMQVKFLLSTAQHTPIISDFGRVMVKDFVVNIPTNKLKPEKRINSEIGITGTMFEKFRIYGSFFYTKLFDAIISESTTLAGSDSVYFGADGYTLATRVNVPQAYIYGISSGFKFNYSFDSKEKIYFKLNSSFNYIKGINQLNNRSLPNISPFYGNSNFTFNYYSFSLQLYYIFNGAKPYDELSLVGEDYIEKATSIGFLPWQTFNAKISVNLMNKAKICLGVDNVFDTFYRAYRTAVVAPGRNLVFSISFTIN